MINLLHQTPIKMLIIFFVLYRDFDLLNGFNKNCKSILVGFLYVISAFALLFQLNYVAYWLIWGGGI